MQNLPVYPAPYNEAELLLKLKARDEAAFSELYDRFAENLYGLALKIVLQEALAEDVVQEAFVKIWRGIDSYDAAKARLFTWLLNITRNTAIDKLRGAKKISTVDIQNTQLDVTVSDGSGKDTLDAGMDSTALLAELPPEQQEVLKYVYLLGYTHEEAAHTLQIPLGTVKSRVRLALTHLRRYVSTTVK